MPLVRLKGATEKHQGHRLSRYPKLLQRNKISGALDSKILNIWQALEVGLQPSKQQLVVCRRLLQRRQVAAVGDDF